MKRTQLDTLPWDAKLAYRLSQRYYQTRWYKALFGDYDPVADREYLAQLATIPLEELTGPDTIPGLGYTPRWVKVVLIIFTAIVGLMLAPESYRVINAVFQDPKQIITVLLAPIVPIFLLVIPCLFEGYHRKPGFRWERARKLKYVLLALTIPATFVGIRAMWGPGPGLLADFGYRILISTWVFLFNLFALAIVALPDLFTPRTRTPDGHDDVYVLGRRPGPRR